MILSLSVAVRIQQENEIHHGCSRRRALKTQAVPAGGSMLRTGRLTGQIGTRKTVAAVERRTADGE
ncbi:MAG: hypothetical protein D6788_07660 [Planctomycetota bacterium]|nr:MAG: hypothetical protein D6788_07660 [Planctomycetota bacterium]